MKKFFIKLLFIISTFNFSIGQDPGCGMNGGEPAMEYFDFDAVHNQNYTLKIYFNIVRDDNEFGGYNAKRLPILTEIMDNAFNPKGIFFEYKCTTSQNLYLNNTDRYLNGGVSSQFCGWYDNSIVKHSDGIDIYIVYGSSTGFAGRASSIPGSFIVLNSGDVGSSQELNEKIESSTIVHELGHLFGLLHMYHGSTQNEAIWENGCDNLPLSDDWPICRAFECQFSGSSIDCTSGEILVDEDECAETSYKYQHYHRI